MYYNHFDRRLVPVCPVRSKMQELRRTERNFIHVKHSIGKRKQLSFQSILIRPLYDFLALRTLSKKSATIHENLSLGEENNFWGLLKAFKSNHTELWETLNMEGRVSSNSPVQFYLAQFTLYTTAATEHTTACYSTEIIDAMALISINKIVVLYALSSVFARIWLAFVFFHILYCWNRRLGRFFNAATSYIPTSVVIFWRKPPEKKNCEVHVRFGYSGSFFIRDCSKR